MRRIRDLLGAVLFATALLASLANISCSARVRIRDEDYEGHHHSDFNGNHTYNHDLRDRR